MIKIRDARLDDVKDILSAQLVAFPDDPFNLSEQQFAQAITDGRFRLLVADYNAHFAGYAICQNRPLRPWSCLDNLIVLPEYRGLGIARHLMHHTMNSFFPRPFLRLFVERGNRSAVSLYRELGFVHLHTKKQNYENNGDALVMYKFLHV